MPLEKHLTIDVTDLGVLRLTCPTCQASVPVPVMLNYQPPVRCPNTECLSTWFFSNAPGTLACQGFVTALALLREHMPAVPVRIQFVIPAPD